MFDFQNVFQTGMEEYDAANDDETGKTRDSNSNTKDENLLGQRQSNASHNLEHKRKRHGKSRRKG